MYDQEINWDGLESDDDDVDPRWNEQKLKVEPEHAKAILSRLIDLLKSVN